MKVYHFYSLFPISTYELNAIANLAKLDLEIDLTWEIKKNLWSSQKQHYEIYCYDKTIFGRHLETVQLRKHMSSNFITDLYSTKSWHKYQILNLQCEKQGKQEVVIQVKYRYTGYNLWGRANCIPNYGPKLLVIPIKITEFKLTEFFYELSAGV